MENFGRQQSRDIRIEKPTPPHPRRPAKPTSGGQEPEKGQPTCQVRARDQCVVKSLQHETLHERAKEPSRGSAARSRHHAGPERQKILLPEDFMVPRSCDTRFHYEAEMFHLRMRRWSVER